MDRYKYSAISHQPFDYCNPISTIKMEAIYDLLELQPGEQIIDFGAGKGELLLRLIERFKVQARGIEHSPYFLQELEQRAVEREVDKALEIVKADATTYEVKEGTFALASCMGASEIFGGYQGTLERLTKMVKPGGYVLIGEGYWKHEPEPAYLQALGATRDEYATHAESVLASASFGLIPLYAAVCSEDDWDRYEWLHSTAIERYAREQPDDPDISALLERIRGWRELYLRWGRDTLGFAIYLFQKE